MIQDYLVRFSPRQRFEHFAVMLLFIVLSVTGFPQKFYDAGWARWLVGFMGGVEGTRVIHRWAGIVFSILTVLHLSVATFLVATGKALPSLIPTRKDFRDAVTTLRYYLGLTEDQAKFDRFDYRQKFEYWGLVFGGVVMIGTGLVLYFPLQMTKLLPGELIPAAKVAHSNEGLMAFLVVVTWHIYNAHLAPGIFPFDKAIFTGKISRHRMAHEHPLELARKEGQPAEHHPKPTAPTGAARS